VPPGLRCQQSWLSGSCPKSRRHPRRRSASNSVARWGLGCRRGQLELDTVRVLEGEHVNARNRRSSPYHKCGLVGEVVRAIQPSFLLFVLGLGVIVAAASGTGLATGVRMILPLPPMPTSRSCTCGQATPRA
jgi:hypothetical protein